MVFALALRVAMKEFDEELRKQGVGWTTELEYWAHVDDITTAELAPLVVTMIRETLERHGFKLRKDMYIAYCPTPERAECIREEMTELLGTASDGEYWTEITTEARKSRAADSETRVCWLTESDKCVKLTWNSLF